MTLHLAGDLPGFQHPDDRSAKYPFSQISIAGRPLYLRRGNECAGGAKTP